MLGVGAAFAYFHDDTAGVAFASVCLTLGLVLIVASEARGLISTPGGAKRNRKQAPILVLIKEVHAHPQRDGEFQEIRDPNQSDLELEVFIYCWLLLAAELSTRIGDIRLTLREAGGYARAGERVSDLENWHRKVERTSDEESDLSDGKIRTLPVSLAELDTAQPLECGMPREGWLHFRIRNATPSEFKTGTLELSVSDSLSHTHSAVASRARHLPGKIWPIPANGRSEVPKKDEPPGVSAEKLAG